MRNWLTPIFLAVAFMGIVAAAGPTVDELSLWADGDAAAIFRTNPSITLEELAEMRDLHNFCGQTRTKKEREKQWNKM